MVSQVYPGSPTDVSWFSTLHCYIHDQGKTDFGYNDLRRKINDGTVTHICTTKHFSIYYSVSVSCGFDTILRDKKQVLLITRYSILNL